MDMVFEKNFKITTRALNVSGAHPFIPRDKKWALKFVIIYGIFSISFVNLIYNIIYHNLKANDFSQTCKNGILSVVYLVITFQYCVLLWHQDSLVNVINSINKDYELAKNLPLDERDIVYKYVNLGVWVTKQWLVICIVTPSLFTIKSIIAMHYYYIINEFKFMAYYDLIYPKIIEDNKDNVWVFLLTYVLMFIYGYYSSLVYLAYVPLGPIFMLHACGQLELVNKKIHDLFVECDDQVIRSKLKDILEHLQYIYNFVDRLNDIFEVAYELTLKGTTLMLPITCYEVQEALNHNEVNLEYLTFIVASTLFSSTPCYYSDLLMEKGEAVRISLYTCGWEKYYDRRTRTTLQLMLQNALKPVAIHSIFRLLCLEALTDLFQQSYALFNLMNAMWN